MSRISVGTSCALLALAGLLISGQLGAQDPSNEFGLDASSEHQSQGTKVSAEKYINAILNQPLKAPLEYDGDILSDVCAQIADEYKLPIQFDSAALDEIAISPETEVTLAPLRKVALRSALNMIFRQPGLEDLTFIIEDEVLLITTNERANETLQVIIYRVDDFDLSKATHRGGGRGMGSGGGGGFGGGAMSQSDSIDYSSLTKVITTTVEFDSWKASGTGEGEIQLMKPGMLVISQTRGVHVKIEQLLDQLREVKAEIENDNNTGSGF